MALVALYQRISMGWTKIRPHLLAANHLLAINNLQSVVFGKVAALEAICAGASASLAFRQDCHRT